MESCIDKLRVILSERQLHKGEILRVNRVNKEETP